MINFRKQTLIITTLVCLLPIVLGVFMYRDLPDQIPVHWNAAGEIDNYMSKPWAVFGLPVFFAVINIISITAITNDPKRQNQSKWMKRMIIWLVPALSVILLPISLFISIGISISVPFVVTLLISILFIVIGNYLPKSRQNYTIGIKLPWTLHDADNWNKTHRLGGVCFIAGGIIIFISNLFQLGSQPGLLHFIITISTIILMILVPTVYSFILYRKDPS